jgi:hypothetical protein
MKYSKVIVLLMLGLFCSHVSADTRLYKIELIIFAQDMPSTEIFEQAESQIRWPRRVVNRSAYQRVTPENMTLHGSYSQLARAYNYHPLQHIAWVQPVGSNSLSRAVKITNTDGSVNGFFRLQRGHLVHMIVDLEYSAGDVIYRLNEKRRFKLNETHYFDHPKFGVLVRVSPLSS